MIAWLPMWVNVGEVGAQLFQNINKTRKRNLFAIIREDYLEWLNEYGTEQITHVTDTTKELIRRAIREGLANGDSHADIISAIADVGGMNDSRAQVIAETETHNTIMNSINKCGNAAGFKWKKWVTSEDASVRPSHQALNGEVKPVDEPFSNGGMYPGDPSLPAKETIRCRCIMKHMLTRDD